MNRPKTSEGAWYAERAARRIMKKKAGRDDLIEQIVTGADVLDIMRCAGGIRGFERKFLRFGLAGPLSSVEPQDEELREQLVQEAWVLIDMTTGTRRRDLLLEPKTLTRMLALLSEESRRLPMLSSIVP